MGRGWTDIIQYDAHQGSILMVVCWPQASKNTNRPLKCLSGYPGWPVKIISEKTLVLVNHARPKNIRVQGKCFLHLTLTRGSALPPLCGESSHNSCKCISGTL